MTTSPPPPTTTIDIGMAASERTQMGDGRGHVVEGRREGGTHGEARKVGKQLPHSGAAALAGRSLARQSSLAKQTYAYGRGPNRGSAPTTATIAIASATS